MQLYARAVGYENVFYWYLAIVFFLLIMILGNIIMLALFTSLLLKKFDPADMMILDTEEEDQERAKLTHTSPDSQDADDEFSCAKCCSK